MAQKLSLIEIQRQQQIQRLSAQHMLQIKLLEMPLSELEQNINAELDDNPALERSENEDVLSDFPSENTDINQEETVDEEKSEYEIEERKDALDAALEDIGGDDLMPDMDIPRQKNNNADYEEMVYGETTSFYDILKEQMDMLDITQKEHDIMEYLIGNLDDDGILRKDLSAISDELAIYHNIDTTVEEITRILKLLQTFDPAGIGARNLQECLLLQIKRKQKNERRDILEEVITNYYEDITKNHWKKISKAMNLSDSQIDKLQKEIRKLNPKPGASLGETEGRNLQQITPDFIIDSQDDGKVVFWLNKGEIPNLTVSSTFLDMVDTFKNNKDSMNRKEKEGLLYAKNKVDKAMGYIEAIRQRQHTMTITMKAIIDWQIKFFQEGDESDLKPMILKDIAEKTGLDISTISRVSNIKYAQTRWGIFPLKFFFSDGYTTKEGEEMSTRKIKIAMKEIIDKEDKHKPLNDDALAEKMAKAGYPIARRTIAKYREQLNIPIARLRKQ